MYNAVCYEKNRLKMVSVLFLLLLIVLLPTEISYASNPVAIMNSSYSVQVCENGTWKSPEKELIFGNYGSVHHDGFLHFMPLKKFVYTQRLPRITPSDDFSYRVISKEPDVSLDYSYAIYNQNWETVLSGETTTPDLSGLDSGKYLMVINVYAKRDDYSEKCLNLVWLIVGDYEETFVFKPLDDGTYHLFEYCGTDEYVEIPSCYQECPVTKVEANAFKGNNVVKTIVVPEGIQEIGDSAFRSCTSLEKVVLSEGVIKIGEDAFASCTSLKDISLPNTLTKIGRRAFSGCKNLKSIMIPKNIYKIERGTFEDCSSLFEVILPSWLLSIEDEAFNRCYALKKVELPEGLLSIGSSAFDGIEFKNLVVPSSLLIIGKHAFSQYSSLLVHTGSLAETYAQSNHLPYSRLNEDYVWLPKKGSDGQ